MHIQTLSGRELTLDLGALLTVGDLRQAVADELGMRRHYLRLAHAGDVLRDNSLAAEGLAGETIMAFAVKVDIKKTAEATFCMNEHEGLGAWTALHYAAHSGRLEIAELLLEDEEFEEVNAVNGRGETALHLAAMHGHADIAKVILASEKFTLANARNKLGETVLHVASLASRECHAHVASAVLASPKFTELDAVDRYGSTSLHVAAAHNAVDIAAAIVADGRFTKVDAKDGDTMDAETALERARRRGHTKIVSLLRTDAGMQDVEHNAVCESNQAFPAAADNEWAKKVILKEGFTEEDAEGALSLHSSIAVALAYLQGRKHFDSDPFAGL